MDGKMLIWKIVCGGRWIDVGYDCYRIFVLLWDNRCYFRIRIVMPSVVLSFVVIKADFWGQRNTPGGY